MTELDPKGLEAAKEMRGYASTEAIIRAHLEATPSPSPAPGVVAEALGIAKRIRENDGGTFAHIIAANDAHNFLERLASLVSLSPDARPIDDTVVEALEMARHELWEMGATESENNALWHVRRALASLSQPAKGEREGPAARFARWLEDGPKLAKEAGCYVGIKVSDAPAARGEGARP